LKYHNIDLVLQSHPLQKPTHKHTLRLCLQVQRGGEKGEFGGEEIRGKIEKSSTF